MGGGAIGPGVVVDLSRMNSIAEVDPASRTVQVGPGALRGAVNDAAAKHGLRFPVDPSSGNYCTIGGMVSTNAAGPRTLRFGATRAWVQSLDCVFDDGSRAVVERGTPLPRGVAAIDRFTSQARRELLAEGSSTVHAGVCKESSGYGIHAYAESGELVDLLVGSEGTLAVIVGVRLLLTGEAVATSAVLSAFNSLEDAVAAATGARASGWGAVACELLDRTFLEFVASGNEHFAAAVLAGIPSGTEAVLLSEVEGDSADIVDEATRELEKTFCAAGATVTRLAMGAGDQHELWELRHAASPILSRLDPSLRSMQFVEDGAVPPPRLGEYVRGVRAALDARKMRGVIFGHAGDAHVHVNPLVNTSQAGWRDDVEGLLDDIVALTARLGGTLAGEHGDGRLRTPLLDKVWPAEALRLFALVKLAFDPRGVLNPGVKVPLAAQRPLGDIKYDPELAALPADARAALDLVASERAYSRDRLSLLETTGVK